MKQDRGADSSNFTLRTVNPVGSTYGALVFVGESAKSVRSFLRKLENVMFPPGGRSTSLLSTDSRDNGTLLFEIRSHVGRATISVTTVPREVGLLVRETIEQCGSLPIIFGYSQGSDVVLIDPVMNYLVKTDAYVGEDHIEGEGRKSFNWSEFMTVIARDNRVVAADM